MKARKHSWGIFVLFAATALAGAGCMAQGVDQDEAGDLGTTDEAPQAQTIDVSGVPQSYANAVIALLGFLGIQPTGTVRDSDEVWCVFNDWRARDQRATSAGRYATGRFSVGTTFGGRWYCYSKR